MSAVLPLTDHGAPTDADIAADAGLRYPVETPADEPGWTQSRHARNAHAAVAMAGALGAVTLWATGGPAGVWGLRGALAAALALMAASAVHGARRTAHGAPLALTLVAAFGTAALALGTALLDSGAGHPLMAFSALAVALVAALAGPRHGMAVGAVALTAVAALGWAELDGSLARAPHASWRVGLQVALVAGGGLVGHALWRQLLDLGRRSREREQRFSGLLGIAADGYWELDARLHLVQASWRDARGRFVPDAQMQGAPRTPWELPCLQFDDDALDALRADLEARQPFHASPLRWRTGSNRQQHLEVSGEPRFDEQGRFQGYWGVARNVTADHRARVAMAATESRYEELYRRLPTPLVLHRHGRVVDANPAALDLLGYPDVQALRGRPLADHYERGSVRDREQERFAWLDGSSPGEGLQPEPFELTRFDGARRAVRAAAVRVDTTDGPATLSIYLDETDMQAAEDAVRRSDVLLRHLVATSPDLIWLVDLESGRHVMVNRAFVAATGWRLEDVVERTGAEVGLWGDPDEGDQVRDMLRADGLLADRPVTLRTREGRAVPVRLAGARFELDGRHYAVLNGRDVSEAERLRRERETIVATVSIGIALVRDGRLQHVNPAFERMLGWRAGALQGQPVTQLLADGPPPQTSSAVDLELPLRRKDGSTVEARLIVSPLDPAHPQAGQLWVAEDATERRRLLKALAQARDDAEAASRAKSAFLANTSHELRTPLNAVLGLARLALQPQVDEPRRRAYLTQLGDSVRALSALLNDILDLSRLETGRLPLQSTAFELMPMLQSLQRGYLAQAQARGLALHFELDGAVPGTMRGDPIRLRQILSHLLGNALKFTTVGQVTLRARPGAPGPDGQARVRFEVQDTGPGLDAATRARLFAPFALGDPSATRRHGGSGLGLSICRQLAQLMRGATGVDSEPGVGSTFWVELPSGADARAPVAGAAPAPTAPRQAGADADADDDTLRGRRVLVAEDNPVNMLIVAAMLEQWGMEVEPVYDGRAAVTEIDRAAKTGRPYDLVLMDLQMPELGGRDATRALRQRHDAARLPIVALTAAALSSERDEALAAGMDDFVSKPIDGERLRAVLVRLLATRRPGG